MESKNEPSGWESINDSEAPEYYVQTLATLTGWEFVKEYKDKSYALLGLHEGHWALDVGCGLGDDVIAMAPFVGNTGQCVGVDLSRKMVERARERAEEAQVNNVSFQMADARKLPFEDATFNGCRADRVLQHVADRAAVIQEIVRVIKPGGRLVTIDPNWETMVFDVPDEQLCRKVTRAICDRVQNGWAGLQSARLFHQAGLKEIGALPITSVLTEFGLARAVLEMDLALEELQKKGALTVEEVNAWNAMLQKKDDEDLFFGAMTGFITIGTKSHA